MVKGLFRHHGPVALRDKIQAWFDPEANWARSRGRALRHPSRHVFLLVLCCAIACIYLWRAVVAASGLSAIADVVSTVFFALWAWYFWLVRRDAHLREPPSWWPGGRVRPPLVGVRASRDDLQPGDRVVLVGWPFRGKFSGRTATLVRPKRWFGQGAWLVDLDGGRISPSRPGTVRTTITERVMERVAESPTD